MDLDGIELDDIDPLIAALEGALAKGGVERIIIKNAPYSNISLTRKEARDLITELRRHFSRAMN